MSAPVTQVSPAVQAAAEHMVATITRATATVHAAQSEMLAARRDLDTAQQAALPVEPPPVVGIRVRIPGATANDVHPRGRMWDVDPDGALEIDDAHGRTIASYPAGSWSRVADVFEGDA